MFDIFEVHAPRHARWRWRRVAGDRDTIFSTLRSRGASARVAVAAYRDTRLFVCLSYERESRFVPSVKLGVLWWLLASVLKDTRGKPARDKKRWQSCCNKQLAAQVLIRA
jgi:hypothetical protein